MDFKKLRVMSPGELHYRLKMAGAKKMRWWRREKYRDGTTPERYLRQWHLRSDFAATFAEAIAQTQWPKAEEALLQHMRARWRHETTQKPAPCFFIDPAQRSAIRAIAETLLPRDDFALADRLLERRFSYLGIEAHFPGGVDWQMDPLSGRRWLQEFYTEMKFYGQREGGQKLPGDVKYVWELNRQHHFAVLGKAYWLTGEEKYAAELLAQCESWITQNPYLWGINWTSALEAGMRALSWLWAYFFCLPSPSMTPQLHSRMLRTLQCHGRYIDAHLSFYTSPYNHLAGETAALFILGLLFPEFPEARRWQERGWKILAAEVTKQFHADGMSVEQAMSYHHFTLGLYLQVMILAQRNGIEAPAPMRERLERALEFCMHSQQPDGRHPMIGDNDNAFAFYFGKKDDWDFREYLSLGALLFQRGDFKCRAGHYSEACLWLLGPHSSQQWQTLAFKTPDTKSLLLRESGYAILRDDWKNDGHYLMFDCGPQSHGLFADENVSTAHGHADALSFNLCAFGKPFLIDAGMLTYNGELEWQNYFRSGQAHNTITIDDNSASKLVGRLGYAHVPSVQPSCFVAQEDFSFVEGHFTGFGLQISHRRGVFYRRGDYWLIWDRLEGEGEHVIDRWFHFAPALQVHHEQDRIVAQYAPGQKLLLHDLSALPAQAEIFCGGSQPQQGWSAPNYGCKIPATVLRLRLRASLPMQFFTLLMPCSERLPRMRHAISGQDFSATSAPFRIRLSAEQWEDQIVFERGGEETKVSVSRRVL